jgi:methylated-DNA-[protein]-cysteine S-methyltransferase
MNCFQLSLDTPVGALRLVAEDSALCAILFPEQPTPDAARDGAAHPVLQRARAQLADYFAGRLQRFDLPLAPRGTAFQREVWRALAAIPFGATCSYADVARRLGRPESSRAVGASNGKNPLPIVVPCHRVIGADGSLTGYAGGLAAKEWLLRHERAVAARSGLPAISP